MTAQRGLLAAMRRCAVTVALGAGLLFACGNQEEPATSVPFKPAPPHFLAERALAIAETAHLETANLAQRPPPGQILGPEPIAILPVGDVFVGLATHAAALFAIDRDAKPLAQVDTPDHPTALARTLAGEIVVAAGPTLARYTLSAGAEGVTLARRGGVRVAGAVSLRDVAASADRRHPRTVYAVDEVTGQLLAVALPDLADAELLPAEPRVLGQCRGPMQVAAVSGLVVVNCFLDHALVGWRISADGGAREAFRIAFAGPLWSLALTAKSPALGSGTLLAASGIEDHPRKKDEGAFEYIDSFVYLYEISPAGKATRLAAVNVSALGAVTPKWLQMTQSATGALEILTSGYGSENLARLRWPAGKLATAPAADTRAIIPGIAAAARRAPGLIAASSLLDAWVVIEPENEPAVVPVAGAEKNPSRSLDSKIGEAIFYTTLATPQSRSEAAGSRFSCEACHFEGYVDGRVHFTGKNKVPATTKPLRGLFGNRPHYSHGLVPTTATMTSVVLMLVNLPTGIDPWFSISPADVPWLSHLGDLPETLSPLDVRQAMMAFAIDWGHEPNPATAGRTEFSELERQGAEVFRKTCASCHAPRLFADDPGSEVAFADWEAHLFSPQGSIVWASAQYAKTGVMPYFHDRGTRVPSLRRLYRKAPYFTNGSARNLAELLDRAAIFEGTFFHDEAPAGATPIPDADKTALAAFLRLL